MNNHLDHEFEPFEKPSKSARKREMTALQELGERLTELTPRQLQGIDLPKELLAAIVMTHGMPKKDARRRQVQFIGRLMRDLDIETQEKIKQYFAQLGR